MRSILLPAALLAVGLAAGCAPTLPDNQPVHEVRWLNQNWKTGERDWYHHASQGTSTLPIPYSWFTALEQPKIWLGTGSPPMLADSAYLSRLGFIPSPRQTEAGGSYAHELAAYNQKPSEVNPDGLPVGFARMAGGTNPITGQPQPDQIGLTCAACHTGHLEYKGVSLRIDGAPAAVDLGKLTDALAISLLYTKVIPGRFERFAQRVLGPKLSPETEAQLEQALNTTLTSLKAVADKEKAVPGEDVEEGFSRVDALTRIGNTVFAEGMVTAPDFDWIGNYEHISAPVKFPQIWYTSWFDWVQYDGSIMQPMVRNAGESMGVRAQVNMANPKLPLWKSTVATKTIHEMEELLAGPNPLGADKGFHGLKAPVWPQDVLGKIDTAKRDRGHALYQSLCQGCHLAPAGEATGNLWDAKNWVPIGKGSNRYLKIRTTKLAEIGTDPGQANIILTRKVTVPAYLGVRNLDISNPYSGECNATGEPVTNTLFALALGYSVQATVDKWYDENHVPQAERIKMNGDRPNCLQAQPFYSARPLDGVWAAPPFLHNGSVPTLYALLSPVSERPKTFCLGNRAYDPVKVGYDTSCAEGTFEMDTSKPGNTNTGHEFRNGSGSGVIGRLLSPAERDDLVEYLKSI